MVEALKIIQRCISVILCRPSLCGSAVRELIDDFACCCCCSIDRHPQDRAVTIRKCVAQCLPPVPYPLPSPHPTRVARFSVPSLFHLTLFLSPLSAI